MRLPTRLRTARDRWRAGVAAVEFALVTPILMTLVAGVIQFGWLFYVQNTMLDAARNVTRSVAIGEIEAAAEEEEVEQDLGNFPYEFDVDVSDAAAEITINVSLPGEDAVLMDFLDMFAELTLEAEVTMPKE
jgi:hypothetical protein